MGSRGFCFFLLPFGAPANGATSGDRRKVHPREGLCPRLTPLDANITPLPPTELFILTELRGQIKLTECLCVCECACVGTLLLCNSDSFCCSEGYTVCLAAFNFDAHSASSCQAITESRLSGKPDGIYLYIHFFPFCFFLFVLFCFGPRMT